MLRNKSQCSVIIKLMSLSQKLKGIYCLQVAELLKSGTISFPFVMMKNCDDT